ncbi:hypothetical protein L6252_01470 [Candidatus Parcubacteria bacterium]|nr:hypothetical protein [Candidatus Parcubacteria bacterium]
MAGKFLGQEVQECIQFHKDDLDKVISKEEAERFLEELEERDALAQQMCDWDWEMEQAEHAMWRKSVKELMKNGIKPLLIF